MINRAYVIALSVLALAVTARPVRLDAQQQAPVRIPKAVLERYAGEYLYPDGATFKVGLEGETLIQEAAGRRLPYTPLSETLFMLGPVITAEFVFEGGGMTQILSDGAGMEYRLRRKGAPPAPPVAPVAAVRVPKSVLEQYVGVYEYIPGQMQRTDLRVVIRLRGDKLTREMGQEVELIPLSETRFKVGNTSLMMEFVVDDWGVTQVLGSGFQQMLTRRTSKH